MSFNLHKGQAVSLNKADNSAPLTSILLGFGWDVPSPKKPRGLRALFGGSDKGEAVSGGHVDVDASAILLDRAGHTVEIVCYSRLRSREDSIIHTGDNLTVAGEGDVEQILIDLSTIHPHVSTVLLTITSYNGHTFDRVSNAFVRVLDASGPPPDTQVVKYDMSTEIGPSTALIAAALRRQPDDGWTFTAIGDLTSAKTPHRLNPSLYAN